MPCISIQFDPRIGPLVSLGIATPAALRGTVEHRGDAAPEVVEVLEDRSHASDRTGRRPLPLLGVLVR